ncbi:ubiquitin hydrolase l3 [Niveomyces insectorum RCEF 264]|uniref:Ubiquitin carboxyl-terminal hydrolase n=1 Tax=Niveomyces insectorum RCEF 264 TaxID=1081102 RepID=A0A167VGE8_9HYPO|nr:ubiquitin hydrolase l3 [Niveomyces insectorum RCEF 264]
MSDQTTSAATGDGQPAAVAASTTTATTATAPGTDDQPDTAETDTAPTQSFVPLEANPPVMTKLLHTLGVAQALAVHDVFSLTEPELLAFVPRPAMALLLVFPVSAAYDAHRRAEDADRPVYAGQGSDEPVLWFRQTIRNACGLMGLLHAAANGPARAFVAEGSPLDTLLRKATPLNPTDRARLLTTDAALAQAHAAAAAGGDTSAPDARDEVDLHYVCFVKTDDGTLWELDGNRKGPIARGQLGPEDDVLSDKALGWGPLAFLARESADLRFSCVALAPSLD